MGWRLTDGYFLKAPLIKLSQGDMGRNMYLRTYIICPVSDRALGLHVQRQYYIAIHSRSSRVAVLLSRARQTNTRSLFERLRRLPCAQRRDAWALSGAGLQSLLSLYTPDFQSEPRTWHAPGPLARPTGSTTHPDFFRNHLTHTPFAGRLILHVL